MKVELIRIVDATPQELFEPWLDPDGLREFMAPAEGLRVSEIEVDPREGGAFSLIFRAGQSVIPIRGEYRKIDRFSRLELTWHDHGTTPESLVTIDFEPIDEGTRLTLRHAGFPNEEDRASHERGWGQIITELEALVRRRY